MIFSLCLSILSCASSGSVTGRESTVVSVLKFLKNAHTHPLRWNSANIRSVSRRAMTASVLEQSFRVIRTVVVVTADAPMMCSLSAEAGACAGFVSRVSEEIDFKIFH